MMLTEELIEESSAYIVNAFTPFIGRCLVALAGSASGSSLTRV